MYGLRFHDNHGYGPKRSDWPIAAPRSPIVLSTDVDRLWTTRNRALQTPTSSQGIRGEPRDGGGNSDG